MKFNHGLSRNLLSIFPFTANQPQISFIPSHFQVSQFPIYRESTTNTSSSFKFPNVPFTANQQQISFIIQIPTTQQVSTSFIRNLPPPPPIPCHSHTLQLHQVPWTKKDLRPPLDAHLHVKIPKSRVAFIQLAVHISSNLMQHQDFSASALDQHYPLDR